MSRFVCRTIQQPKVLYLLLYILTNYFRPKKGYSESEERGEKEACMLTLVDTSILTRHFFISVLFYVLYIT